MVYVRVGGGLGSSRGWRASCARASPGAMDALRGLRSARLDASRWILIGH